MEHAIKSYKHLKVGQSVWHVYGINRPFMSDELIVVSAPQQFRNHESYDDDCHDSMSSHIVFDVTDGNRKKMHFATDGNLIPGYSHNRNYWFGSAEEARDAVKYLQNNPESDYFDWHEDDYYGYDEE